MSSRTTNKPRVATLVRPENATALARLPSRGLQELWFVTLKKPWRTLALVPAQVGLSIRPLAEELRVNRNTVAKAYTELESQGIIETIVGKGSFIRPTNSPYKKDVRRKILAEAIDEAVVHAHHLQIGKDEFLRLSDERFDALEHKRARATHS